MSLVLGGNTGLVKVLVTSGRRRAALALVAVAVGPRSVRVLGFAGEFEETELTYLGAGPEQNGQCCHVREF